MMGTIFKVGLSFAVFFGQAAWADQPPVKREAEKAQRVKTILEKYPLAFSAEYSYGNLFHPDMPEAERQQLLTSIRYKEDTAAFCNAFYGAMKRADKAIRYVEPIVRSDDPNHPGLKRYHACPDYYDRPFDWGGNERTAYVALDEVGDRAYRLYRFDLDGNPRNGLEEYIYAELDYAKPNPYRSVQNGAGYRQIDLKRCLFTGGASAHQDAGYGQDWRKDNYNALIRFRGKYYIFDLYDLRGEVNAPPFYRFNLHVYLPTRQTFDPVPTCTWDWENSESR